MSSSANTFSNTHQKDRNSRRVHSRGFGLQETTRNLCREDMSSSSGGQTNSRVSLGRSSSSATSCTMSLNQKDMTRNMGFRIAGALGRKFSKVFDKNIDRKAARSQANARKSVLIMFLVSLAFIISYLPYLILRLLAGINSHFVTSMTDTERIICRSFLRSYWLNCAINPFIYCACAQQFRNEYKLLWRKIKNWRRL